MEIKEKLTSKEYMTKLILSEDRHDFSNFLYEVLKEKESGSIDERDFYLFRNGYIINTILSLPELVKETGRQLQTAELLDKINYISLVPDTESLNISYTNKKLIDGVTKEDKDLSWWFGSGIMDGLPLETRNKIALEFLKNGDLENTKEVLNSINRDLEYERKQTRTPGKSR